MATSNTATRDFSSLGLGSVVNGLAAYAYAAAATHAYGSAEVSGFAQLWTIWLGATAVLTFPVQHWLVLRGARGTPRRALVVVMIGAGLTLLVLCSAFRTQLFDSSSLVYPLLAGAIGAGAVPIGVCRGRLIATGQARRAAFVLGAENVLRLIPGIIVVVLGGSVVVFSLTTLVGYLIVVAYLPAWHASPEPVGPEFVEALHSIGLIGASTLVAQLVLTGGPLLLGASDVPATVVTATFATLAVFRSVYLIALGTSLRFTAMLAEQRDSSALRRIGLSVTALGVIGTAATAVGAWLFGRQVVGLLFGHDAELPRGSTTLIAAGSMLAVTALLLVLVAYAANRSLRVLLIWLAAAAGGGLVYSLLGGPEYSRFAIAFFVVECTAVLGLAVLAAGRSALTTTG